MLKIKVPPQEVFNDDTSEFLTTPGGVLELEHSLISISKGDQNKIFSVRLKSRVS